jgi:hypothetical protein
MATRSRRRGAAPRDPKRNVLTSDEPIRARSVARRQKPFKANGRKYPYTNISVYMTLEEAEEIRVHAEMAGCSMSDLFNSMWRTYRKDVLARLKERIRATKKRNYRDDVRDRKAG